MKKIFITGIMLMMTPFVSFAQTATTTVVHATGTVTVTTTITDAGLLPNDFFYFLDRWSEALSMAFTFNKENKARKHLEYAKERVAEMKEVLKNSNGKIEDILTAKENFDERVAKSAALTKEEKDKGSDVSGLARELDDELDGARDALKDIFKEHKDKSSQAEEIIRAKIASLSPNDPQIAGLTQALESITKEKDEATKEKDGLDNNVDLFDETMGNEISARKHIEDALRYKAQLGEKFGQLSASDTASFTELLKQANAALAKGDFESAKNLAKQAKKLLEKAKDALEKVNDEMKNKLEKESESRGGIETGMPIIGGDDVNEKEVNGLEEEINKSEKMMGGVNAGEPSNDTNDVNR